VFTTVAGVCVAEANQARGTADEPVCKAPDDVDTVPKVAAV
jgi:hypothetical protein